MVFEALMLSRSLSNTVLFCSRCGMSEELAEIFREERRERNFINNDVDSSESSDSEDYRDYFPDSESDDEPVIPVEKPAKYLPATDINENYDEETPKFQLNVKLLNVDKHLKRSGTHFFESEGLYIVDTECIILFNLVKDLKK